MCKVVGFFCCTDTRARLGLELICFWVDNNLAYPPRLSLSAAYDLRPTIKATLT